MSSHVSPSYGHVAKQASPGSILNVGSSRLKWYEIADPADGIPPTIRVQAMDFLTSEALSGAAGLQNDLGFVLLHRCGRDFYFLLIGTWRGSNELWETVYAKENDAALGFSALPIAPGHHATWCVWELGVVHHEMKAWTRYLMSARGADDVDNYLSHALSGPV